MCLSPIDTANHGQGFNVNKQNGGQHFQIFEMQKYLTILRQGHTDKSRIYTRSLFITLCQTFVQGFN